MTMAKNKPKPSTSESIMITNIPIARLGQVIASVESSLIRKAKSFGMMDYIYVMDSRGCLKGVVSVKDMFQAADKKRKIEAIMRKEMVTVHPHTHQESVVRLSLKHGIKAVPVVDKGCRLLGAIPHDTILRALNEELHEDIYRFIGMYGKHTKELVAGRMSAGKMVKYRLPWLVVGLFGGIIAASLVGLFEHVLSTYLILAAFMPVLVYMSGAVGAQSQTILVRSMALEPSLPARKYVARELKVAVSLAFVCSAILAAVSAVGWGSMRFGAVIGLSLFFSIFVAVVISTFLPLLLKRMGMDPAIATGPFATVLTDMMTIVVYFSVASVILLQLI